MSTRHSIGDLRGQKIIDSRDVIARIEELQDEREGWCVNEGVGESWEDAYPEDAEELADLKTLADEGDNNCSEWHHGETLIADSYFEDYAQELAEDIGAINRDATWPNNCIDWDRAAKELQYDYTSVEFGGEAYWIRS